MAKIIIDVIKNTYVALISATLLILITAGFGYGYILFHFWLHRLLKLEINDILIVTVSFSVAYLGGRLYEIYWIKIYKKYIEKWLKE